MYTVEFSHRKKHYVLFKYGVRIGLLTCSEEEANNMVRMLNTHPLADEEI